MNPLQLVRLLRGHKNYIQTHNVPDPDAAASAFGLQFFLKQHGVDAQIFFDGVVNLNSTKQMFEVFGIDALSAEKVGEITAQDYIVTVDAQKYNANLTDFPGREVACIDHHPTYVACTYDYKDIRPAGACASLIAEYFYKTDTPLNGDVAAALAYGMKVDTDDFIRGVTDLDLDMFAYVYKHADVNKLVSMYNDVMELRDLKAYSAAIENIHIRENVGFACIPLECPDALVAIISDFILSLNVVEVSIIYAVRKDGVKFSVRSEDRDIDAGKLIGMAMHGIGSGGGHHAMAGGFIPRENVRTITEQLQLQVEKAFLDKIHILRKNADEKGCEKF